MIDLQALKDPCELAATIKSQVLPPPPVLTVSEWADRERILGPEETSEPGRWKTDRIPYLKEIMDAVSNPEVRTVVVKGSARIGKTELENNSIGYFIDQDPSAMLLVYPSEGKAEDYSKEKLTPMLKNTPALRGKVAPPKTTGSDNTILYKKFRGGYLAMVGSNTPNGLDSRTVRVVLFDELDKCAKAAKHLGDPIALAKNRTITYPGRWKHILVSTPSEEGDSPITTEYEKTNMQRLYVPCPHCGEFQVLKFAQIRWADGKPEEAVYACEHCGAVITDSDKPEMLRRHEWRAEKPEIKESVGFSLWAAYSPWVTFAQIAQVFTERRKDGPESLKVFVNEWLGETWKPNHGQESKVEGLLARARESRYASGTVPDPVGILFASSDVQDDRLEFLVRGVGVGRKQWTVQHVVLPGNPATMEPWDRLEHLILSNWTREDGQGMRIKRFCIDTGGHFSREAMAFCKRPRLHGIAVPIKGASHAQIAVAVQSKRRSRLWTIDTVALKDTIYASLRIDNPEFAGYQAFPNDLEAGYFQQLMSERKVKDGQSRKYETITAGARNEVLDMHVYCDAAMAVYGLRAGELEAMVQFYADRKAAPVPIEAEPEPDSDDEPECEEKANEPEPPPPEPSRAALLRPLRPRRVQRVGVKGMMGW